MDGSYGLPSQVYTGRQVALHDGKGHYIIAMPVAGRYDELFYGDGKVRYQQRVYAELGVYYGDLGTPCDDM